jgi:hypothetical protein
LWSGLRRFVLKILPTVKRTNIRKADFLQVLDVLFGVFFGDS